MGILWLNTFLKFYSFTCVERTRDPSFHSTFIIMVPIKTKRILNTTCIIYQVTQFLRSATVRCSRDEIRGIQYKEVTG